MGGRRSASPPHLNFAHLTAEGLGEAWAPGAGGSRGRTCFLGGAECLLCWAQDSPVSHPDTALHPTHLRERDRGSLGPPGPHTALLAPCASAGPVGLALGEVAHAWLPGHVLCGQGGMGDGCSSPLHPWGRAPDTSSLLRAQVLAEGCLHLQSGSRSALSFPGGSGEKWLRPGVRGPAACPHPHGLAVGPECRLGDSWRLSTSMSPGSQLRGRPQGGE